MIVQKNLDFIVEQLDGFNGSRAKGSATVTSTNTTVAVTYGKTIVGPKVVAAPTADPGGRWWLSAVGSTGFTINLQTAAPVGGVSFDWQAEGD